MLQDVPGDGNASENKFLEARMRCQSSRPLSATGPVARSSTPRSCIPPGLGCGDGHAAVR